MSSTKTHSICVFAGSSANVAAPYREAASDLGRVLGERGIDLVYGGGRVGLMGLLADSAIAAGGRVIGIIPKFLMDWEVGHEGLDELIVTESMHDRKRAMYDRADGFISLPGGLGTLDETFEALTWTQLKLASKPIILLNTAGYWDPLVSLIKHIEATNFASATDDLYQTAATPEAAVDAILQAPVPPATGASERL